MSTTAHPDRPSDKVDLIPPPFPGMAHAYRMVSSAWKTEYRDALRTAEDLFRHGLIDESELPHYHRVIDRYSLFLPRYYAGLIEPHNPHCPIRLQALPNPEELRDVPGELADPLGDLQHRPVSRITHRYKGRALLHLTVNCPMYCRYCFRKSLLNEDASDFFSGGLKEAFDYVEATPELEEVILSGGDPLMVSDSLLGQVLERLSTIRHLKRVRIHTRAPVTMPARIDDGLARAVQLSRLPLIVVTHFNHPREVTMESATACRILRPLTAALLNQSVLLRGVNDSVETLKALCERVFEAGVLPYYLHQLDKARGTAHFEVSEPAGRRLFAELKAALPGYLVPRYVQDMGDSQGKTWMES